MKILVILILSCVFFNVDGKRVKRIVGGEKAAIPRPLEFSAGVKNDQSTAADKKPSTSGGTGTSANAVPKGGATDTIKSEAIDETTVAIYEEDRTAKIHGVKETAAYVAFKGIRYAKPPLEKNRFQRPIFTPLNGDIDASKYGSPCVQPTVDGSGIVGQEDCLFLNVYTPQVYVKNATGFPVFFWIHGGGFVTGSGNQYGVAELVKKNIVVVTLNYRLGSLGFFGSHDQQMSGNAGLFDVKAAFEWTTRYITYFGGDPQKIITAGQGTGASLAMLLAQSDFTSGSIKGVFAMSGTGITSNAVDYRPENTSEFISKTSSCANLSPLKTVRCLQKAGLSSIVNAEKALQNDRIGSGGFVNAISLLTTTGPLVEGRNDGRFLPYFLNKDPIDALRTSRMPKVPLLTGTTKSETGSAIQGKYKDDVLKKLQIPGFLTNILPRTLIQNNVGIFINEIANKLINTLFGNDSYLGLIFSTISKGASNVEKVVETTTDAIFNLPLYATSHLWNSAGGESYVYSFEHESTKPVKGHFLESMSIFSGSNAKLSSGNASHGDDLMYLFELQTLDGKSVPESSLKDSKDKKVKDIFVDVVAEFVHNGKPKINELNEEWPPFRKEKSFAVIAEKPRYQKKFRFCQMALWGGFLDTLTDPFCNFPGIQDIIKIVPRDLLNGGILNPANITNTLEKFFPIGGLVPGGNNTIQPLPSVSIPPLLPPPPGPSTNNNQNGFGGLPISGLLTPNNNNNQNTNNKGNKNNRNRTPLGGLPLLGGSRTLTQSRTRTNVPLAHVQLQLPLG